MNSHIPDHFICPLTLEIMNDPVITREGQNFERQAIVEWLNQGNTTCPLTRQLLSFSRIIPNPTLRVKIELWKRDNGMEVEYIQKRHDVMEDKFFCSLFTDQNEAEHANGSDLTPTTRKHKSAKFLKSVLTVLGQCRVSNNQNLLQRPRQR